MDKGEVLFHLSIMAMLFVVVVLVGYKMVFISEAYIKAIGV
ncbi:MAG: hypothetical protein WC823_04345 [Parcubacteria group bacterium]|jgi:hypothetical protein